MIDETRRALITAGLGLFIVPRALRALVTYDVTRFGAKGDGVTNDTAAIQRAIDAAARAGGTVVLPAGKTFLSGTLTLKDNITFFIETGATLKATGDRDDFRALGALLFALRARGVTIAGGGTIDGNFRPYFTERDSGGWKVTSPFLGPYDPLYDKPGKDHPDGRPRVILLVECQGARLRDFTIRDAPTWTIHTVGCENLSLARLTIRNNWEVPNCDGMGIDHCQRVRIESCDVRAADDGIVLRASRMFNEYGPSEDIVVSNCVLSSRSAAIKIDPEGPGTVRMASVTNCTIEKSNRGICVHVRDGGTVENLVFSDMAITTELQESHWWGAGEPVHVSCLPRATGAPLGAIRHLEFNNLICAGESGAYLRGCDDVTLNNVQLTFQKTSSIAGGFYDLRPGDVGGGIVQHRIAGVYAQDAQRLALRGVSVQNFDPALEAHHVTGELIGITGSGERVLDDVR
jgi:hypothetical protein